MLSRDFSFSLRQLYPMSKAPALPPSYARRRSTGASVPVAPLTMVDGFQSDNGQPLAVRRTRHPPHVRLVGRLRKTPSSITAPGTRECSSSRTWATHRRPAAAVGPSTKCHRRAISSASASRCGRRKVRRPDRRHTRSAPERPARSRQSAAAKHQKDHPRCRSRPR